MNVKNKTLVSIGCTTYNHDAYITQALDGFLMQKTSFPVEIIAHDDASTDKTTYIIREYYNKHPDVIKPIFQTENQYLKGKKPMVDYVYPNCLGKYIALCEGDDYWTDPYKLQKQADFLEANPHYSMCFTNSVIVNDKNDIIKKDRVPEDKKHNLSQKEILSGYCPPTNTVLVRTELIKKYLPYFTGFMNGDFFMFSLLAQHGEVAYMDFTSAAYRIHANGVWSTKDEDYRLINFIKVNRKLENLVLPENKTIVLNSIKHSYKKLTELNSEESFTDGAFWTPQTVMLRAIRDTIIKIDGIPKNALSIGNNPTLEKTLLRKWPEMEIIKAHYPHHDAQNLHQFKDESFYIVFSHQVLEHIPKPWIAAKEMNRVLKRGGIGIHTSCAYNPRHGYPAFKDYYRFLPDGLAELFDGVNVWAKGSWGNKQALIYNLTIDDGHGQLGGRRFVESLAKHNDENYPWHTWIIFQKN